MGRAWIKLFGDLDIPAENHATAQRVVLGMLSGFALEVTMRDDEADFTGELTALERTLERILRGEEG